MQVSRIAKVERKTNETDVSVTLGIDGTGVSEISTGMGFFDHMLANFAKQGLFDLKVSANGDLNIDEHHTIEDVAIALGKAFNQALGDKKGIQRYGFFELPMDESLARAAVDISGRSMLVFNATFLREKVGEMPTEMLSHFFESFAKACECTLHIEIIYGTNEHHKIECIFKAFARAMKMACSIEPRARDAIPSTKGSL